MNRIACERVRGTLRAHVAGELDDAERTAVGTHLAGCPPCRAEAARERALTEMLEGLPTAPPDLPEMPELPPPAGETRRTSPGRAPPLVRAGVWAAAAAAIVVAAASWRADRAHPSAAFPSAFARFVDVDDPRPGWDERTLELAAGAEAVAMRRPAESR